MLRQIIGLCLLTLIGNILFAQKKQHEILFQYAAPKHKIEQFSRWESHVLAQDLHQDFVSISLNEINYSFKDASTLGEFKQKAPKILQQAMEVIPKSLDRVLNLTGQSVLLDVILVDDTDPLQADPNSYFNLVPIDGQPGKGYFVLPDGNNLPLDQKQEDLHVWVCLGARALTKMSDRLFHFYKNENRKQWLQEEVIKGMINHVVVRALIAGSTSSWGGVDQQAMSLLFPHDKGVYLEELWSDQQYALVHGLGRYYAFKSAGQLNNMKLLMYHNPENTHSFILRKNASLAKNIDPKLRKEKKVQNQEVWAYEFGDLPGQHLLHSETMVAIYLNLMIRQTDDPFDQRFEKMVDQSVREMLLQSKKHHLAAMAHSLSLQLEDYLDSREGMIDARKGREHIEAWFPYAALDAITHFSLSKAELRKMYQQYQPEREPASLSHYVNQVRPELKKQTEESWQRIEKVDHFFAAMAAMNYMRKI